MQEKATRDQSPALVAPDTYFKMDTAQMFQESVRAAVLEAVDALTTAKGHWH